MPLDHAPMPIIDLQARMLVRIAAAIAGADELSTRRVMETATGSVEPALVDEVILQSYLFAGFPRALNAARAWRAASGEPAPANDAEAGIDQSARWEAKGEATCATVYGSSYEMLRENIRALHPALDAWMITDGYGKVLSRRGLDLKRRELCIVAACAASGQQRQLHSHLHGALNCGATVEEVRGVLDVINDLLPVGAVERYKALLGRVQSARAADRKSDQAD